jgi:hypothetical protein
MKVDNYGVPLHVEIGLYSKKIEWLICQMNCMYLQSQSQTLSLAKAKQLLIIVEEVEVLITRPESSFLSVIKTLKSVHSNDVYLRKKEKSSTD